MIDPAAKLEAAFAARQHYKRMMPIIFLLMGMLLAGNISLWWWLTSTRYTAAEGAAVARQVEAVAAQAHRNAGVLDVRTDILMSLQAQIEALGECDPTTSPTPPH